jgi:cysteine desulfurase
LNAAEWLSQKGWKVTFLDVDEEGFVNPEDLEKEIRDDTFLVSIIHGNNEIGAIQNLERLGEICQENDALFHTDACQSLTKTEIDVKKQNVDLMTLNAHKIHGPKGVGSLYVSEGTKLEPLQHGGGHEDGLRSGTENIPGVVGFAKAIKISSNKDVKYMKKLRDKLIKGLQEIEGSELNGPEAGSGWRLCNNINFTFDGVEGEAVGGHLDAYGIESSTGSACSSHSLEPSHVLLAIGKSEVEAHGSLRLSLSKYNTEEDIDKVIEVMPKIIKKLRKISPFEKIVTKVEGK